MVCTHKKILTASKQNSKRNTSAKKHAKWLYKSQNVFKVATPCRTAESVGYYQTRDIAITQKVATKRQ